MVRLIKKKSQCFVKKKAQLEQNKTAQQYCTLQLENTTHLKQTVYKRR